MKILVTGGAGFIGSNFIRHVLGARKDYELINYDNLTYAGNLANLAEVAKDPNYTFIRGDICDAAAVEAAMRGCDAVIHFAAESHVDRSIYEPAPVIDTNIKGTFTLLEVECLGACDRAPVVMVNDAWHECLKPDDAVKLVDDLRRRGEAAVSGCHLMIERVR